MFNSGDCQVCKLVRFYLLLAVPLVAILGLGSFGSNESGMQIWFARVELIDYLAWGASAGLLLIVSYRGYLEFWVPKRRRAALERLLKDNDSER